MIITESKILYHNTDFYKRLWDKYMDSVTASKDESVDIKGLYHIKLNFYNVDYDRIKNDELLLYYRYYSDKDDIDLYFKNEKDCLLWRLKYGI